MSSHWSIHRVKCHFPTEVYLQVKHVGETHCSLAIRVKEHNDSARNNVQGQPLSDHYRTHHSNESLVGGMTAFQKVDVLAIECDRAWTKNPRCDKYPRHGT